MQRLSAAAGHPEPLYDPAHLGIGVQIQRVNDQNRAVLGLKPGYGWYIADLFAGSPAQSAGVRPGDIITAVDGIPTDSMLPSGAWITKKPGDTVQLRIARAVNGREQFGTLNCVLMAK